MFTPPKDIFFSPPPPPVSSPVQLFPGLDMGIENSTASMGPVDWEAMDTDPPKEYHTLTPMVSWLLHGAWRQG